MFSKRRIISLLVSALMLVVAAYMSQRQAPTAPVDAFAQYGVHSNPLQLASPTLATSSVAVGAEFSRVIRVVDGDTTVVDLRGVTTTVRLIGINTPETVDPRKPVQCFGKEASNEAKRILTGASVRVVQDPTQGAHDKYGRLLAYLFLPDGTLFNEHMVAAGFAYEYTYNAPYKYQLQFKADQAQAQKNGLGLWAPGVCSS